LSILDSGLTVIAGSAPKPVEVLISHGAGAIEGTIEDGGTTNFSVVLVPKAPRKSSPLQVAFATHDEFKFEFKGVPPGEYRLFAFDKETFGADYETVTSDELINRYASQGVPITMRPSGVVKTTIPQVRP
jgi:hypothetical protein